MYCLVQQEMFKFFFFFKTFERQTRILFSQFKMGNIALHLQLSYLKK